MINRVTYSIIARKDKKNKDGVLPICLQAFVNGQRDVIPLYKYVPLKYWDNRQRRVKDSHPEAVVWNREISNARTNAGVIIMNANEKNLALTKEKFRALLTQCVVNGDFVQFALDELEKRKGELKNGTYKQHKSSIKKLSEFRKEIAFSEIELATVIDYESYLKKKGNSINTVATALKNFQTYIKRAYMRGFDFPDPFKFYKIRKGHGRRIFCTVPELHSLLNKYDSHELPVNLQESLLIFLVESFASMRIGDIKRCKRSWLNDGELTFEPSKTEYIEKWISFRPPAIALRLLEDLFKLKDERKIKEEQKINLDLKVIAALCGVNKSLTTHVARHTFATTYLKLKGKDRGTVQALQKILGHTDISTTMIYVHLVDEEINEQLKNFDNEFK